MNRIEKRELKKDKSLICTLYNIVDKYLPKLFTMFEELSDRRQKRKVTYSMKTICITRLFGLLCGITTMNSLTNKFNTDETISNLSKIIGTDLSDLPHYDTINDIFDDLNIDELRSIQKYIVYALIRSKMFDRFRYQGKFQVLVDSTGLVSFNHKHCDHCLVKKHSDGHISYEHQVLEAKLVFDSFVISLDSEFIENPVITADALYASGPFIKLCLDNGWHYIFRLKSDKLQTVNSDFGGIISVETGSKYKNYFLVKDYIFNKYKFNIVRYIEKIENKSDKIFTYITNLKISDLNIKTIIDMGRRRWKIENQGFNSQKNIIFDITHMCSLDYNAMKAHYFFIQFAHTIRQLLDLVSSDVRCFQNKLKEISHHILTELISTTVNILINHSFQLRFDNLII